jgi:ElaB/YqjD/DUF883 family membrane-anchored ribosome-binding protein
MCLVLKKNIVRRVLILVFINYFVFQVSLLAKTYEPFVVDSGTDAKKLIASLTTKLKDASKRQVSRLEQNFGEKFKPTKRLVQQQQEARTRIESKVLPLLTRKVETTVSDNKPARMKVIDGAKISDLSVAQLSKLLENLASGLRVLPPLTEQVPAWAKTLAPLLSFDKKTKAMMSGLVNQWFDVLLKSESDLETLARISSDEQSEQHDRIAQLRGKYKEYYHNMSQLLYPWVQIVLLLDVRDPVGTWLQYATNNPDQLRTKFKKLVELAENVLEKAGKDSSSEADARGFILLAIASLFAPEEFFKDLGAKGSVSTKQAAE